MRGIFSRVVVCSLVVGALVGLDQSQAEAAFLCCDLINGGCSYASATGATLATACPEPDANGWMVTIATVDQGGSATVGSRITAPPFHGVCLPDAASTGIAFCVPLIAGSGLRVQSSVESFIYPTNAFVAVGLNVILGASFGMRDCYLGGQVRDPIGLPGGLTGVIDNSYSCYSQDWNTGVFNRYLAAWTKYIADLEIPPVVGTMPRLLGPSQLAVGRSPTFTVWRAFSNQPILWWSFKDGVAIDIGSQIGVTDDSAT